MNMIWSICLNFSILIHFRQKRLKNYYKDRKNILYELLKKTYLITFVSRMIFLSIEAIFFDRYAVFKYLY